MGAVGATSVVAPAASAATFRRRLHLAIASGARGIVYWSGNAWHGGPWIFHGSLLDHAGTRVPEWPVLREFGEFLERRGSDLLAAKTPHDVAVIGSHAGSALAQAFQAFPNSGCLAMKLEAICRQRGLAVDVVTPRRAAEPGFLDRYRVVMLAGEAQGLATPQIVESLRRYAGGGGTVVVGPLAGYVNEEGAVPARGLGAELEALTGVRLGVFRWLGEGALEIEGEETRCPALMGFGESVVELPEDVSVRARFLAKETCWQDRPALLLRRLAKGQVWKLLAVPDAPAGSPCWEWLPPLHPLLAEPVPDDVLAVPRADGSLMCVSMAKEAREIVCAVDPANPTSPARPPVTVRLEPGQLLWLGPA